MKNITKYTITHHDWTNDIYTLVNVNDATDIIKAEPTITTIGGDWVLMNYATGEVFDASNITNYAEHLEVF